MTERSSEHVLIRWTAMEARREARAHLDRELDRLASEVGVTEWWRADRARAKRRARLGNELAALAYWGAAVRDPGCVSRRGTWS